MSGDSTPRWLDEHERCAWLGLGGTFTLLPAALDSHLQREAGISLFEYSVMAVLSEQPDHTLQLKDLAILANGSLSRLSHVITRLERRGWVRRCSESRSRATHARLTELGYQKVVETAPLHVAEVRRLVFDALTAQQVNALEDITSRINAAIGVGLRPPRLG
jgi:DNA-binding MarR family transcriptional regulator